MRINRHTAALDALTSQVRIRDGAYAHTIFEGHTFREDAHVTELTAVLTKHGKALESIAGDKRLSTHGKADATREAAKEVTKFLETWGPGEKMRGQALALDSEARALAAPPEPADPMAAMLLEMRQAEVRRGIEALDPLKRTALYLAADVETQRAIEAGPLVPVTDDKGGTTWRTSVTGNLLEQTINTRTATLAPEKVEQAEALREFASEYDGMKNTVLGVLKHGAGPDMALVEDEKHGTLDGEKPVDDGGLAARAGGAA